MRQGQRLIRIDGGPGTGKSTTIIRRCSEDWQGKRVLVITYTNAAADVLRLRAPWVTSGTVYALLWPYVSKVLPPEYKKQKGRRVAKSGYQLRPIQNSKDIELKKYLSTAPSRQQRTPYYLIAEQLHGWSGISTCPVDFDDITPEAEVKYILPLAYWLNKGAPVPESHKYDVVVIDEAQDMSALEVTVALQMLKEGGTAYAYGDPGQAIFSEAKGLAPGELPYAWTRADEGESLGIGYRCGSGIAGPASSILREYYDLPSDLFTAPHTSQISRWDIGSHKRPTTGMVLCLSRKNVDKVLAHWKLSNTAVVPGIVNPNDKLVVCTGHAAKGAEADEVFVSPWTPSAMKELYHGSPDVLKLLYVMMTRARKKLYLPGELLAVVESRHG